MSEEAIKKRIVIDDPAKVDHDPLEDIKNQQGSLNIAIQQHEGEPEIQDALRKQKDALGEMAKDYENEKEFLKEHKDGGGAWTASLHNSGNLGDTLSSGDGTVRTFTRTVNKFAEDGDTGVAKSPEDVKKDD